MNKPPKVKMRSADPLQDYYNDGTGNLWSVAKLLDDSKDLPVFDVPLAALNLSGHPWEGDNMFALAFHVKRCMSADLDCPILISWDGGIADGRHRIIKAVATGKTTIKARRMQWRPDPDRKEDSPP